MQSPSLSSAWCGGRASQRSVSGEQSQAGQDAGFALCLPNNSHTEYHTWCLRAQTTPPVPSPTTLPRPSLSPPCPCPPRLSPEDPQESHVLETPHLQLPFLAGLPSSHVPQAPGTSALCLHVCPLLRYPQRCKQLQSSTRCGSPTGQVTKRPSWTGTQAGPALLVLCQGAARVCILTSARVHVVTLHS